MLGWFKGNIRNNLFFVFFFEVAGLLQMHNIVCMICSKLYEYLCLLFNSCHPDGEQRHLRHPPLCHHCVLCQPGGRRRCTGAWQAHLYLQLRSIPGDIQTIQEPTSQQVTLKGICMFTYDHSKTEHALVCSVFLSFPVFVFQNPDSFEVGR